MYVGRSLGCHSLPVFALIFGLGICLFEGSESSELLPMQAKANVQECDTVPGRRMKKRKRKFCWGRSHVEQDQEICQEVSCSLRHEVLLGALDAPSLDSGNFLNFKEQQCQVLRASMWAKEFSVHKNCTQAMYCGGYLTLVPSLYPPV